MSKSLVNLAILIVLGCGCSKLSFADDRPPNKSCRQHPQLSGRCFTLRGRLSLYNGTPSRRIWPVGSDRLLGISEGRFALPGYTNLPPNWSTNSPTLTTRCLPTFWSVHLPMTGHG
jgi:hypothetical protein